MRTAGSAKFHKQEQHASARGCTNAASSIPTKNGTSGRVRISTAIARHRAQRRCHGLEDPPKADAHGTALRRLVNRGLLEGRANYPSQRSNVAPQRRSTAASTNGSCAKPICRRPMLCSFTSLRCELCETSASWRQAASNGPAAVAVLSSRNWATPSLAASNSLGPSSWPTSRS